jgi:hypothetical protein
MVRRLPTWFLLCCLTQLPVAHARQPARLRWAGHAQLRLRSGRDLPYRSIDDASGRAVNTPLTVPAGARATFRGTVGPNEAKVLFRFRTPLQIKNGLAYVHALPDGRQREQAMVGGALSGLSGTMASTLGRLARRAGFLDALPVRMKGIRAKLVRQGPDSRFIDCRGYYETEVNLLLTRVTIPFKSHLKIPRDRISTHLVGDLRGLAAGDVSKVEAFARILRQEGYVDHRPGQPGL